MKKYTVSFWEKQSLWVRQTVEIETDVEPTKENIENMLDENPDVVYVSTDNEWETMETEEYDFDTDFEVEESGEQDEE